MKNSSSTNRLALYLAASTFIFTGCVSTGTHEKMQAEKNQEIAGLQQEKTALEQQKVELQKQLETLGQQKHALEAQTKQRQAQNEALVRKLAEEVERGDLKVRQYQNMTSVDVAEQIFFDSGRATLKQSGNALVKKLGEALKGYDNKLIRVVGHTDNVPLAKSLQATFPSNWELSVARATNVVRALQEAGVPPERMVASGRGEFDPLVPNDSAENRQKNRRIEIMLIDMSLVEEMSRPKQ